MAIGASLAAFTMALAPALARFYGQSRLFWIAALLGSFRFQRSDAQHGALMSREMRFMTQAKIDVTALALSSATGVVMAALGWRYWSLVAMGLAGPIASVVGVWLAVPWVPGPPRRNSGVLPTLHFGGLSTLNNFLVYLAWNSQNILLGRYWGADALGIYGRAHPAYDPAGRTMDRLAERRRALGPFRGSARSGASFQVLPQSLFNAPLGDRPHCDNLPALRRRNHSRVVGGKMDGGCPDLQVACSNLARIRIG